MSSTAGAATVAVSDDDEPPPTDGPPTLDISDAEGGELVFTVSLSHALDENVEITYFSY